MQNAKVTQYIVSKFKDVAETIEFKLCSSGLGDGDSRAKFVTAIEHYVARLPPTH